MMSSLRRNRPICRSLRSRHAPTSTSAAASRPHGSRSSTQTSTQVCLLGLQLLFFLSFGSNHVDAYSPSPIPHRARLDPLGTGLSTIAKPRAGIIPSIRGTGNGCATRCAGSTNNQSATRVTAALFLASSPNNDDKTPNQPSAKSPRPSPYSRDSLIEATAYSLRRTSWLSWWSQVILTAISAVILLFARSIGAAESTAATAGRAPPPLGFLFGSLGITISITSIFWTWGGARLSRRLLRGKTSRINAANLLRRAITVGTTLNLSGMAVTLLGTFAIIGGLATKVLTAGGYGGLGALGGGLGGGANAVALQTVQPLDILIVQANANTLLSHFVSLFLTLFLTRFVGKMDPPSTED